MGLSILGIKSGMVICSLHARQPEPTTLVITSMAKVRAIKNTDSQNFTLLIVEDIITKNLVKKLREVRVPKPYNYPSGGLLTLHIFNLGEKIIIKGKSIGKGFSGTIKRHKFTRGPMTHGSKNHRLPGSLGPGTYPARVYPGKKMPGRLGGKFVKILSEVNYINYEENFLGVKGSVPGKKYNRLVLEKIS